MARILTRGGRATGVVLENGDEILADVVVSSVDPRLTFERFLEPTELPDEFLEGVRRYKYRGSSGKVNLALDGLPDFTCAARPRRAPARRDLDLARAWTTWSAPTTTRSTGASRAGPTSTS